MAVSNNLGVSTLSFLAGATVGINRMVQLSTTADTVIVTSAITDLAIGVALNAASTGELVEVAIFGVQKVVASGAITIFDQVMPTASGAGKVVTAGGATAKSCGIALKAAATDGDTIEVLLHTPNVNGVANS